MNNLSMVQLSIELTSCTLERWQALAEAQGVPIEVIVSKVLEQRAAQEIDV
jgi:pyrroloquinoline quinone (PQQ) biosynthesis protein C